MCQAGADVWEGSVWPTHHHAHAGKGFYLQLMVHFYGEKRPEP
jgi:hypothetical protein